MSTHINNFYSLLEVNSEDDNELNHPDITSNNGLKYDINPNDHLESKSDESDESENESRNNLVKTISNHHNHLNNRNYKLKLVKPISSVKNSGLKQNTVTVQRQTNHTEINDGSVSYDTKLSLNLNQNQNQTKSKFYKNVDKKSNIQYKSRPFNPKTYMGLEIKNGVLQEYSNLPKSIDEAIRMKRNLTLKQIAILMDLNGLWGEMYNIIHDHIQKKVYRHLIKIKYQNRIFCVSLYNWFDLKKIEQMIEDYLFNY